MRGPINWPAHRSSGPAGVGWTGENQPHGNVARLLKNMKFFDAVRWNPHLKAVREHRPGQMIQPATKEERRQRGRCPWTTQFRDCEIEQPAWPPARLTAEQVAGVLNCQPSDGKEPPANSGKAGTT